MKNTSLALRYAHVLYSNEHKIILTNGVQHLQVRSWSQCLKMGWFFVNFRKILGTSVVTFSYCKQDGSIREARGTLSPLIIPREDAPMNCPDYIPNYRSVAYYDIDAKGWRAFRTTNWIGFMTIHQIVNTNV